MRPVRAIRLDEHSNRTRRRGVRAGYLRWKQNEPPYHYEWRWFQAHEPRSARPRFGELSEPPECEEIAPRLDRQEWRQMVDRTARCLVGPRWHDMTTLEKIKARRLAEHAILAVGAAALHLKLDRVRELIPPPPIPLDSDD